MKGTKRIVALITVLSIILTIFTIIPITSAAGSTPDYTVEHRTRNNYTTFAYQTDNDYAALGTSLISGKMPTLYKLDSALNRTEFSGTDSELAKITDGNFVSDSSNTKWAKVGSSSNPMTDVQYDLGSVCSLDNIVVAGFHNPNSGSSGDWDWATKRYIGKYEVYLSESLENLYDSASLVYSYDGSSETNPSGVQVLSLNKEYKGRYFAVRVLQSYQDTTLNNPYPHFCEIAVYGESVYNVEHRTRNNYTTFSYQTDDDYAALGTSLISGKKPTLYKLDSALNRTEFTGTDSELAKITDGNFVSDSSNTKWAKVGSSSNPMTDVQYDLGGVCSLDNIVVAGFHNPNSGSSGDWDWATKRYIGKYEVYLSESLENLYDSASLVYSYDGTNETNPSGVQVLSLNKEYKGRYFAVRVLKSMADTSLNNPYPHFCEIAVYGESVYNVEHRNKNTYGTFSYQTDDDYNSIGTNLLSQKMPTVYELDSALNRTLLAAKQEELAKITDNEFVSDNANTKWAKIQSNTINPKMADIEYDFGSVCSVNKIVIASFHNPYTNDTNWDWAAKRYNGEYEVYLSESLENLYDKSNLVYSYNYNDFAEPSGVQVIDLTKAKSGKYFAVRVLNASSDESVSSYPHFCEIAAYDTSLYTVKHRTEDNYSSFTYTNASYAALGENLLFNKSATPYSLNVLTGDRKALVGNSTATENLDAHATKLQMLTNGDVEGNTDNDVAKLYYHGGAPIPAMDLEYDLGTDCTVEKFVLVSQQGTDFAYANKLFIGEYEVYLADSKEDLYKSESLIYSYNYKNEAKRSGVQEVIFKKALTGRYLAVRIINPVSPVDGETVTAYPRIVEIGLFGDDSRDYSVEYRNEQNTADFLTDEAYAALGNNLLADRLGAPYSLDVATGDKKLLTGNETKSENLNDATNTLTKLTNGKVFADNSTAGLYYHGGEGIPAMDIEYNLGSICKINKFVLIGASICMPERYTGKYEVYLSDDKDNLYDANNLIYAYDYETDGIARGQIVSFEQDKEGQYLAVRILKPVTTATEYVYPRISEIGVFGTDGLNYTVEYIREPDECDQSLLMTNQQFATIGKSLIAGTTPRLLMNGVQNSTLEWAFGNKLNDGDLTEYTRENCWRKPASGDPYVDIIYDLGEDPIDIEKFAFMGISIARKHYYTGNYRVYVAEEYDELFLESTLVYEYDRTVDKIARGQIVTFKEKPRGCYIAVRIVDPNMVELEPPNNGDPWITPKISEIAVYGEKANIVSTPMNLAIHMPVDAYLTDANGNMTEIAADKFTAEDIAKLTDGNTDTNVVIETDGKELSLVYNLCKSMSIDEIILHTSSSPQYKPEAVKIYAAEDMNGVWDETSLAKNGGISSENKCAVSTNGKKMRYVRIVICASKQKKCSISEIEIIGLDRQRLKYKNLALSIAPAFMQAFSQNKKSGNISYINLDSSTLGGLVNNDKNTVTSVEGGNPEKDTLNLEMYLGDLKTVSAVSVYFKDIDAYKPTKMYIYACESEAELLSKDIKPVAVFDGLSNDGVYQAEFKPMLARYIRVCVPEGNPLQNDYETYCLAFTEVSIMGTAVVGTQTSTDNDALLSYKDENTNISYDIVRLDTNDIFQQIASTKIVKSTATQAQKASLYSALYKVLDDTIYEIQFFDLKGEKITNLQGRKLRIKLPISREFLGGQMMFGCASDSETIALYETLEYDAEGQSPYIYVEITEEDGFSFVITQLTSEDDAYWEFMPETDGDFSGGTDDNLYFDNASDDDKEGDNKKTVVVKKYKKKIRKDGGLAPWVLPVSIGGAVILLAGITLAVILFIKKRKNRN